jgi:xanthine dehydrogenase accessory factor
MLNSHFQVGYTMESIYKKLAEIETNGTVACICTVIETSGSVPRKAGAKMIVYPDGSIDGTVGGGLVEKKVIDKAIEVFSSRQTIVFEFELVPEQGMTCGGKVKVFIEPVNTLKKLYIFGAGHIGRFLAPLAQSLGFGVTVIDDRPGITQPLADKQVKTLNMSYQQAFGQLKFDNETYICVLTQSHTLDREAASYCAKQPFAYLGVIGSKNKIAAMKDYFLTNKLLTNEEMAKITWPIGIDIVCQTPQEIAVSILAQLIDCRNQIMK